MITSAQNNLQYAEGKSMVKLFFVSEICVTNAMNMCWIGIIKH